MIKCKPKMENHYGYIEACENSLENTKNVRFRMSKVYSLCRKYFKKNRYERKQKASHIDVILAYFKI